MSGSGDSTSWAALRQLLVDRYHDLRTVLTRRLGSADAADETLHELYLRMDRQDRVGTFSNPAAYLLTSAVNLARDRWRTEQRRAQRHDVEAFFDIVDETPGVDRIAEGQQMLGVLMAALKQLTPRQRTILVAVHFEQLTHADIANRLNISTRLVRLELQRALEHCEAYRAKNS
jgi:RNA polymerase sigma factor (sigma-70 family)